MTHNLLERNYGSSFHSRNRSVLFMIDHEGSDFDLWATIDPMFRENII